MSITIDVQYASSCRDIPDEKKFSKWATTCLDGIKQKAEITIRIVDECEISELNKKWRGIDKATNVLSFPAGENKIVPDLLGDVVICAPIILKEANEQQKDSDAHCLSKSYQILYLEQNFEMRYTQLSCLVVLKVDRVQCIFYQPLYYEL